MNNPDDAKDATAIKSELEALKTFLESPEFRVAKKVSDLEAQAGIRLMLDIEVDGIRSFSQLLETRAEVRALQKFEARFQNRLEELTNLLAKQKQPLDD